MSTPAPTQTALLQATRQKLDELDALIQRMLAVPVVATEEDPLEDAGLLVNAASTAVASEDAGEKTSDIRHQTADSGQRTEDTKRRTEAPQTWSDHPSSFSLPPSLWLPAAINRGFDLATLPLGPAGTWLRGEAGRALLGFTGLALLTAAAVLGVLDSILLNW
jgi:hypothetical protein